MTMKNPRSTRQSRPPSVVVEGEARVLSESTENTSQLVLEVNSLRSQLFQSASERTILERQVQVLRDMLAKRTNENVDNEVTISLLQQQIQILQAQSGQQEHATQQ